MWNTFIMFKELFKKLIGILILSLFFLYLYFLANSFETNFIATNFFHDLLLWWVIPVISIILMIIFFINRHNILDSFPNSYGKGRIERIQLSVKKMLSILFLQSITVIMICQPFEGMAWFFTDKFASNTYKEEVRVIDVSLSSGFSLSKRTNRYSKRTAISYLTKDQREHTVYLSLSVYEDNPGIKKLKDNAITLIGKKGLFGAVVYSFNYPSILDIENP